ncbi:MAG: type II secretion system F family protein [Rhodospirillaceae bacterium]
MIAGPRRRHLRRIIERASDERAVLPGQNADAERRRSIQAKLKELADKRAGRRRIRLRDALAQAGLSVTPLHFVGASIAAAALCGLPGLALSPPVGVLGALIGGIGLPHMTLKYLARRRLAKFTSLFAEALDIVIRGIRSGLPLGECLNVIAREMREPVAGEFSIVTEGIRLGMTMEEALKRLWERVPTPEVRFFSVVVGIQQQTGGNLAETLSKLADMLRARKRMRDKVQAMSTEAKTSAGIIGSLPILVGLMLLFVAPDYVSLLFSTSLGNWILLGSALVMSAGVLVMRQMINFEI